MEFIRNNFLLKLPKYPRSPPIEIPSFTPLGSFPSQPSTERRAATFLLSPLQTSYRRRRLRLLLLHLELDS
ncbi:unnamed protein product [Lactuca virosa]|uniref:Uncharacterized protein n=1 Tax=Lactuca virosa TaxID=75947 RepID=A0AAU9LMW5_9ASTR|nr:unnamed protein product [Lactuca virosa]